MSKGPANALPAFYSAAVLPRLIEPARRCGYAVAVHGSMLRDLDIVAVPWTEDATSAETLVAVLVEALGWHTCEGDPEDKPHGRRAWTLGLMAEIRVDLSVMPRNTEA